MDNVSVSIKFTELETEHVIKALREYESHHLDEYISAIRWDMETQLATAKNGGK